MAKKETAYVPVIQPQNLPKVSRFELPIEGGYRLNPFEYNGFTYRLTGYDIETDMHSVKCVDTGEFKEKPSSWIKAITTKK